MRQFLGLIINKDDINKAKTLSAMWTSEIVLVKDGDKVFVIKDRYGLLDNSVYTFEGRMKEDV